MLLRWIAGLALMTSLVACKKKAPPPAGSGSAGTGSAGTGSGTTEVETTNPQVDPANGPTGQVTVRSQAARADTSLTADAVVGAMASDDLPAISRSYRAALLRDPALHGELTLALTVDAAGHAAGTATGVEAELAACATARMKRWTFDVPTHAGAPTAAAFEIVLALAPQ